jgi:hypothetical protein
LPLIASVSSPKITWNTYGISDPSKGFGHDNRNEFSCEGSQKQELLKGLYKKKIFIKHNLKIK